MKFSKILLIILVCVICSLSLVGCLTRCSSCGEEWHAYHFTCPDCSLCFDWFYDNRPLYCSGCGYAFLPACVDCGKVCKGAFCKLCGAEQ